MVGPGHLRGAGRGAAPDAAHARSDRSPTTGPWPDCRCADRLRELDFEIPMARRRPRPGGAAGCSAEFADALRRHLPSDDPMRAYADRLESPSLGGQVLRGYLSGSIDVVLRVGEPDRPRFVVVDYKTNTPR